MKYKKTVAILAAATVGCSLLLNGCTLNLPSSLVPQTDTTLSAEMESEALVDGNIQIHIRLYDNNTEKLAGTAITFSDGSKEVFSGITDVRGRIDGCQLPGNTELTMVITDAAGQTLSESKVVFKLSSDYADLSIIAMHEEEDVQRIEIPTAKADFSAAIFVSDDQTVTFANLMPYSSEEVILRNEASDSSAPAEAASDAAEGADADAAADTADSAATADKAQEGADKAATAQEAASTDKADSTQENASADKPADTAADGGAAAE